MKSVFEIMDGLVFGRILSGHTAEDLDRIRLSALDADIEKQHRDFIFVLMDALDSKSAALLTHISLIVAALTFLYTSHAQATLLKWAIVAEISLYLLLTLFCLRSIRMTSGFWRHSSTESKALEVELFRRRSAYNFAASSTVAITVVMIITLIASALTGGASSAGPTP